MRRPKRRRWVNEEIYALVKTQPCACCGQPADDPHHLIGHGQEGWEQKAHDIFTLPLCRDITTDFMRIRWRSKKSMVPEG